MRRGVTLRSGVYLFLACRRMDAPTASRPVPDSSKVVGCGIGRGGGKTAEAAAIHDKTLWQRGPFQRIRLGVALRERTSPPWGPRSGFLPGVSDGFDVGAVSGPNSTWPTALSLRKRPALRRSRSVPFLLTAVTNVPCWEPPLCAGLDEVRLVASATANARPNR